MSTLSVNEEFTFRAVLIQIQNALSDSDHGSLDTALKVLQSLFDQLKVSKDNLDYLVQSLKAIERHDCAQRLLDYQKLVSDYILPSPPDEHQPNSNAAPIQPSQNTPKVSKLLLETIADYDDEDMMNLPQSNSAPIQFNPPDPAPLDMKNIDLTPFEDPSIPWTKEYSEQLSLGYHPRNYQVEIIRDAIRHGNTIVCLRTGSGKTFIAAVLIKYYFIKKQKTNPDATFSTLFFVPRKAIRLQQATAIDAVGNLRVRICEDDQTIDQLLDNHVVVSTPQKFVNCLKNETVRLSQIDLMIFDECHNTSGAAPYSEIMKFYLCPSRKQNNANKPTIIGLTATISARDTSEKKEPVEKNLVSLCSRLACTTITTVCDPNNIEEINREISRPKNDQFEYVSKVQYNSYFNEYLSMFTTLIELIKHRLNSHQILDDREIGTSAFIGQLIIFRRGCEAKGEVDNRIICDYLLLLTRKYSALKDLPFDMVLNHISLEIDEYYQADTASRPMNNLIYDRCKIEIETILKKHHENATTNSKLDKLVNLLKSYAPTNTKGLILVQKTFYAKMLDDYLSAHSELQGIVKSTWIVGQNSSDFSLTIHDQEHWLIKFRADECNVLVATDIVQEGLDIPTCSYVIRYEFVSDEIGTIQSRGRARASDSSYYLITEEDSVNHRREKNNKIREDDMEEAIQQWPQMKRDEFDHNIVVKSKSLIDVWERELKEELEQKRKLQKIGKKTGSICCRKCNRVLGRLEWLKRRNTIYFINNPEFLTNNDCQLNSVFERFQENLAMGNVKCICGESLGGCQKFIDRSDLGLLCALKCKQIKFLIEDRKPYIEFTKWTKNDRFGMEELEEI